MRANAKINFYLEILRKREDGYHEIETIMQEIDLFDELDFHFLNRDKIFLEVDGKFKIEANQNNLVYRACEMMKNEFKIDKGVEINLTKNIPFGAGLGGGSSDAASVLKFLCNAWELDVSSEKVSSIAKRLGADVGFFLQGARCFASGIGEKLQAMKNDKKYDLVLIFPNVIIPTKKIYERFSFNLTNYEKKCSISGIINSTDFEIKKTLFNRLEKTAMDLAPQIRLTKNLLFELGLRDVLMSGSGSSVFGIASSPDEAEKIKDFIAKNYDYQVWNVSTL